MDDIEQKYSYEFQFTEPVVYKDIIKLYPVYYRQNYEFSIGLQCLLFEVMDYPNIEYATLPRLYFLTEVLGHYTDEIWMQKNFEMYLLYNSMLTLLNNVLKEQPYEIVTIGNNYGIRIFSDENKTKYVDITSKKFEEIRQIILYQNGYDFSDEFVHNDIKKYIQEQNKFNNKDDSEITSEDYMDAVMIEMKIYDEKEMAKLTLRRFNRFLAKILNRDMWKIQTTASLSGMVTFKEDIPFWLANQTKKSKLESYFKKIKLENPVIVDDKTNLHKN